MVCYISITERYYITSKTQNSTVLLPLGIIFQKSQGGQSPRLRLSGFFKLLHDEGLRGLFRGAGIKLKRNSAVGYIEPIMTGADTMIKFFHSGLKERDLRLTHLAF